MYNSIHIRYLTGQNIYLNILTYLSTNLPEHVSILKSLSVYLYRFPLLILNKGSFRVWWRWVFILTYKILYFCSRRIFAVDCISKMGDEQLIELVSHYNVLSIVLFLRKWRWFREKYKYILRSLRSKASIFI